MESIQNAYQGFAKQNYTMLDNLKLGYGGTKGEMERLIIRAKELDLPLEINMYGMRDGRHYPRVDFWELVGRIGAPVVAGMDCHRLSHVANKDEMNAVASFADRYRLDLRDKLRLVSPAK